MTIADPTLAFDAQLINIYRGNEMKPNNDGKEIRQVYRLSEGHKVERVSDGVLTKLLDDARQEQEAIQ